MRLRGGNTMRLLVILPYVLPYVLLSVRAGAAQAPTAPPKADYPLIESIEYPDDDAARTAWEPMAGSAGVSVVEAGGRKVLRMPCNFAGTRIERASWDRAVAPDLAACRGIQFRFFCNDPSPVSHFSFYFRSGRGWYAAGFYPATRAAWETITIAKADTRIEGDPAGWGQIDRIRISAWRGRDADTEFFLSDIGLLGADAPIAIIRAESMAAKNPGEGRAVDQLTQGMAQHLDALDLSYVIIADRDVTAKRLRGRKLVILPHNPAIPDGTADALGAFLRGGGKMLSFYTLPPRLAPLVGIERGQYIRQPHAGYFSSMRFADNVLPGVPAVVKQQSHNITTAKPVEGKSLVAARWYDETGQPTGHEAVLVSDNCIHMTHVLLSDDPANKRRMLLAMVGHLMPEAWEQAARLSIERIGAIGPHASFAAAQKAIQREAEGNAEARRMLDRAAKLRADAIALRSARKFPAAIATAGEAKNRMLEAYCCAQKPKPGEHRAFWCHSAFGVAGMEWDEAIRNLADNGFTAILPNMLWGGVAYYESDVLPVASEVADKGDQIAKCVAACRKYGVACHVWKVNWNMSGRAPKAFRARMQKERRTQVLYDGTPESRWLCPSHPENQKLEIDSMVEVARKYDVDGIHFDYIRYPHANSCFCNGCRKRFEKITGAEVKNWPADVRNNETLREKWLDFRRGNITTVVAAVSERARKAKPGIRISAAVFRDWPADRDKVGQDWKRWCDKGYLDFVCPMDYTESPVVFEDMVTRQLGWAGKTPCYPGIGLSVWRPRGDVARVIDMIKIARRHGTGGFTVFNYGELEAREVLPLLGKGITRKQ